MQNNIFFLNANEPFSLAKTLNCGQTFRFEIVNGRYFYPFKNTLLEIYESNKDLTVETHGDDLQEREIRNLFGLNHDVASINTYIECRAPMLHEIIEASKGLRIMRMLPYETTLSFIFSIQTSIPIIRKRLNLLGEMAGDYVTLGRRKHYLFPKSTALKKIQESDIKLLHLGFRERFVKEFIENYDEQFFDKLSNKSFDEKRKALLTIKGVGEKVAQCVLLFGFGELSAFPVDVWIDRAMQALLGLKGSTKKLTDEGRKLFGDYAGYAQEYIYYFIRVFGLS